MHAVLPARGIQTLHDRLVSEIAQRWAKAFQCKVTIKTDGSANPWAHPQQQADIVGWFFSPRGNRTEWIAEVETSDSLSEPDACIRWQRAAVPGVPLYLLVPRSCKAAAEKLASAAGVQVTRVYEYECADDRLRIL